MLAIINIAQGKQRNRGLGGKNITCGRQRNGVWEEMKARKNIASRGERYRVLGGVNIGLGAVDIESKQTLT